MTVSEDLSPYTTDSTDADLAAAAGCDLGLSTAWYEFTTTSGGLLTVNAWIQDGPPAQPTIATGAPGSWNVVQACDFPLYEPVLLQPGTYTILIGSPFGGGTLAMDLSLQAPPSNDTLAGALSLNDGVVSVPDLSAATDDAGLGCTDVAYGGLWFTWTAPTSRDVRVDSAFNAFWGEQPGVVQVATGSPGDWSTVTCGTGPFAATAGTQYVILVSLESWWDRDYVAGLSVRVSDVFLSVDALTLSPMVALRPDGVAAVRGTVTCSASSGQEATMYVAVTLSQRQSNRRELQGWGETNVGEAWAAPCDGTPQPWLAEVRTGSLPFKPGVAVADVSGSMWGNWGWDDIQQTARVNLVPGK